MPYEKQAAFSIELYVDFVLSASHYIFVYLLGNSQLPLIEVKNFNFTKLAFIVICKQFTNTNNSTKRNEFFEIDATVLNQLSGLLGTRKFKMRGVNPKFRIIENLRITAETYINKKD